jgi:pilus assembly protein CpaF
MSAKRCLTMASTQPNDERADSVRSGETTGAQQLQSGAAAPAIDSASGFGKLARVLHERLFSKISRDRVDALSEVELRIELVQIAEEIVNEDESALGFLQQEALINQVVDEIRGYGPLGALMREADVSEILINGPHQVFIERRGQLHPDSVTFRDDDHLLQVIRRMIAPSRRLLGPGSPMVDVRLPDGSRLNAVLKPPALNGPLVSIRRFGARPLTVDDLLANDSLATEMLDFLAAGVKTRLNTIISGGTGSGKTTLLNALSRYIPSSERVVTIEDTAELELQQPHVAKLESQPADLKGEGEVKLRDLVRNALRMRPDRIIVGECRGPEALDMLQAMNTGHEGSMTTVHANSTREALARIELMINLGGSEIATPVIRKLIQSSINLVVQIARLPGGKRRVIAISEIAGAESDTISMHDLFVFTQTGVDANHAPQGYFRATGIRPQCLNKLVLAGTKVTPDMFSERRLPPPRSRGAAS